MTVLKQRSLLSSHSCNDRDFCHFNSSGCLAPKHFSCLPIFFLVVGKKKFCIEEGWEVPTSIPCSFPVVSCIFRKLTESRWQALRRAVQMTL